MQTNNKLREALTKVKEWMEHRIATCGFEASATFPTMLKDVVLPALAEPVRNCDVGTAEEQEKRFHDFCRARHLPRIEESRYCAYKCPLEGDTCCELAWAQMPYVEKEGGAK